MQATAPERFLLAGELPSNIQGPRSSLNFFIAMDSNTADIINLSGTLPSHRLYLFLHKRKETTLEVLQNQRLFFPTWIF